MKRSLPWLSLILKRKKAAKLVGSTLVQRRDDSTDVGPTVGQPYCCVSCMVVTRNQESGASNGCHVTCHTVLFGGDRAGNGASGLFRGKIS